MLLIIHLVTRLAWYVLNIVIVAKNYIEMC